MNANLKTFRELFSGRGMTVDRLAQQTRCGRSHLTQVLLGKRAGPETRAKLKDFLTQAELEALGWSNGEIDYQI